MSPVLAGDLSVETQLNFAGFHHVARKGNVVVPPSFLGCYYRNADTRTRFLVLVLINQIYSDFQHITASTTTGQYPGTRK